MQLIKNGFKDARLEIIESTILNAWYDAFNFLHLAHNEEPPREL